MMTKIKPTFIFFLLFAFGVTGTAQETWSLEKCIEHARQNNLNLRQAAIAVSQAELIRKGNKMSRLPNLNANTNFGWQFGQNVNPTTNDFVNTRLTFNNWSLNAGMNVFNAGLVHNSIKQSEHDLQAAQHDANDQFQNIALQMASAYLNILLAEEQVTIAQKALEQTQEQLDQVDKRIQAGVLPAVERLDILAQIARNEQTLIQAENNIEINYLTLKNLLELEPDYDLKINLPASLQEISSDTDVYTLEAVYGQALNTQASIRASEARMKSAALDIPIAKADGLPRVRLFAGLDTRFAKATNFPFNPTYWDQLDQNFGQSVGAQVSIPIYNNHQVAIGVERAKLGVINRELQYKQAQQQLKADVQNAIASARAARSELAASEKSLEAAQMAYDNAQKRYELGAVNSLELTNAKTNLDTAALNVARAKYDYIFRQKIIDFYLGKSLSFE